MANRTTYQDHGLIFAKEPADLTTPGSALGQPVLGSSGITFRRS